MSLNFNSLPSFDSLGTESTSTAKRRGRPPGVRNGEGSGPRDERKQSLYFDLSLIVELKEQAKRIDRSLSWLVGKLCTEGLDAIKAMPDAAPGSNSSDDV
jgi:uncharacterized small protein (TIGR04563 family)